MSDIRQLLSYNCYQISDVISEVWYQTSDMRHLISENKHHWHQMSDNSYNITYNIRCLIAVIWQHMSSGVWYQTSDMTSDIWCYMLYNCCRMSDGSNWCLILDVWYDISFLIKVMWCQTSNVGLLLSYNCYLMSHVSYQTSDVWCLIPDVWHIPDVWCLLSGK